MTTPTLRLNQLPDDGYETDVSHAFQKLSHIEIHSPSQNLPTAPKLRWSTQQHTVLCIFMRLWEGTSDLAQIFNAIFKDDIAADGLTLGASPNRMMAMWTFMGIQKASKEGNKVYKDILSLSKEQLQERFGVFIELIEDTAMAGGIMLKARTDNAPRSGRKVGRPAIRREPSPSETSDNNDELWSARSSSVETKAQSKITKITSKEERRWNRTIQSRLPPPEAYAEEISVTSQNKSGLWSTLSGLPVSQVSWPIRSRRILWRAYNYDPSSSEGLANPSHAFDSPFGFRAGRFRDSSDHITVPPTNPEAFRSLVESHLSDDGRKDPTPFISLTENPVVAFRRALSLENGTISVIDLQIAVDALQKRFPYIQQCHWIVNIVVRSLQLALRGGYGLNRTTSEHLLWGEIDRRAVVTTFRAEDIRNNRDLAELLHLDDLQQSLCTRYFYWNLKSDEIPRFDHRTGKVIARLIRTQKPYRWRDVELIAAKIVMAWTPPKFRDHGWTPRRHQEYTNFMNSVFDTIYCEGDVIPTYPRSFHDVEIYGQELEDCITVETPGALNAQNLTNREHANSSDEDFDDPSEEEDELDEIDELGIDDEKENIRPDTPTLSPDSDVDSERLRLPKYNVHLDLAFRSPSKQASSATPRPVGQFQLKRKRFADRPPNWERKDREPSPTRYRGALLPSNGPSVKRARTRTPGFPDPSGSLLAELRAAAQNRTPVTISSSAHNSALRRSPGSTAAVRKERDPREISVIDLTNEDDSCVGLASLGIWPENPNQNLARDEMTETHNHSAQIWLYNKLPVFHETSKSNWNPTDIEGVALYEPSKAEEELNPTQTTEGSMRDLSRFFHRQVPVRPFRAVNLETADENRFEDDIVQSIEIDDNNEMVEDSQKQPSVGQQEKNQKVGWALMIQGDGLDLNENTHCQKNGE